MLRPIQVGTSPDSEGYVLLKLEFSSLEGVAQGVYHRLKVSADRGLSQQKETRILFEIRPKDGGAQHAAYYRVKASIDGD